MPCASAGRDLKKCAKRVTTHSPGIPLKSNSRVPQPVLCRNLCRRKERQSTCAAHEDLLRSALPRRVRYEVNFKSAATEQRQNELRGAVSTPLRAQSSTPGAEKTAFEATSVQKCTFRKGTFPKPLKFHRVARSLCCFSHTNFSDSEKVQLLTPSRKGPGPTFGASACADPRGGNTFRLHFRARSHFGPKWPKCEKVHF